MNSSVEVQQARVQTRPDGRRPPKDEIVRDMVKAIECVLMQGRYVSAMMLGDKVEFFAMHPRQRVLR